MLRFFVAYVCTATVYFPIDLIWIGAIARTFYRTQMGVLLSDQPKIAVGVAFYVLYTIGLVTFAVGPALAQGSWRIAAIWGAAFGFFAYMTYDLTNLATLTGFGWTVALVDLAWGVVVSTIGSTGGYVLARFVMARLQES